jgi:hypothetical protein
MAELVITAADLTISRMNVNNPSEEMIAEEMIAEEMTLGNAKRELLLCVW